MEIERVDVQKVEIARNIIRNYAMNLWKKENVAE